MLNKLINRFLRPRHFWRHVGFDELSELYSAQLLRSLGMSLIGLFTPIYLYTIGYSLIDIALLNIFWFSFRPFSDIASAYIVAKIGPKHSMLMASLLHVTYLGLIISIEDLRWPLWLVALAGTSAYGLHILATAVDFSKIKHSNHGGKELGYLEIMQKIGGVLGPLVGGLIANYTDPRYTIALAMFILLCSTIPLFFTTEAVMTNQKITFRGLPFRRRKADFISVIPTTIENNVSLIIWPIYAAIFILGADTFAKMGIISAVSTAISLFVVRWIGKRIDSFQGRTLLRRGVVVNAFLHLLRIVTGSPLAVLGLNIANEPVTASYRMPYIKGVYDASDGLPGYRIAYLTTMGIVDALARLSLWVFIWVGLHFLDSRLVLQLTFIIGAISSFGIMLERFEALDKK